MAYYCVPSSAFLGHMFTEEGNNISWWCNDPQTIAENVQSPEWYEGESHQEKCKHVSVIKKHCSATGMITGNTKDNPETKQENKNVLGRKSRRAPTRPIEKNEKYWEWRRRNNAYAKKSRDAKREREAMTRQLCAELAEENRALRNKFGVHSEQITDEGTSL